MVIKGLQTESMPWTIGVWQCNESDPISRKQCVKDRPMWWQVELLERCAVKTEEEAKS